MAYFRRSWWTREHLRNTHDKNIVLVGMRGCCERVHCECYDVSVLSAVLGVSGALLPFLSPSLFLLPSFQLTPNSQRSSTPPLHTSTPQHTQHTLSIPSTQHTTLHTHAAHPAPTQPNYAGMWGEEGMTEWVGCTLTFTCCFTVRKTSQCGMFHFQRPLFAPVSFLFLSSR